MSGKSVTVVWLLICGLLVSGFQPVASQVDPLNPLDHFIYPTSDQNEELRQADKEACYAWASDEARFDPFVAYQQVLEAQARADAAGERNGEVVAGAAKGALRGLLIASIADSDRSEGAARGAAAGGLVSGIKRRRGKRAAQSAADEQREQAEALVGRWDRGYVACLEARKYTVG